MTLQEYMNAWKILRSIDRADIERAGWPITNSMWLVFRSDPTNALSMADDRCRQVVWGIVEGRMSESGACANG